MNTNLIELPTVGTSARPVPTHAPLLPIRRVDDLEVPAAGAWPLLRSSSVRLRTGRQSDQQLTIRSGWLDLHDDPTDSWLRIDADDLVLDLTSATISADHFELSAWAFHGDGQVGAECGAAELALRYHGVFRRGERMWAWFTGVGEIAVPATPARARWARRQPTTSVNFDLLFGSIH